jgi:PilZ domain
MPVRRTAPAQASVSEATPLPASIPALPDRRVALRHRHTSDTVCHVIAPGAPGGPAVQALVWNISTTGLCVLFPGPYAVGSVLAAALATGSGSVLPVVLRVVHCRPLKTGEYAIGARFERPLTEAELTPFVAPV